MRKYAYVYYSTAIKPLSFFLTETRIVALNGNNQRLTQKPNIF